MASKLHSNAIITGCLDMYCLVCNSHLECDEDANDHIEKPLHKINLNSSHYLETYKDDRIRKINKGYFCEFCNLILATATKAGLHVNTEEHNNIKGIRLLKRAGNAVVASNDVLIVEKAWNGFVDKTCAVCNIEFSNEHLHKCDQKHILNLVQKKVKFGAEGFIYRWVDTTSFQCLTCNKIFALDAIKKHFKDENHKKLFAICREFNKPDPNSITFSKVQINKQAIDREIKKLQRQSKIDNDVKVQGQNTETQIDKPVEVKEHSEKNMVNRQGVLTAHSNYVGGNVTSIKAEAIIEDSITLKANSKEELTKQDKPKSNKVEISQCNGLISQGASHHTEIKKSNNENKAKILDNAVEFQKNGVNINFETEMAFCRQCFQNVDLDFNVIENHILEHKNNQKVEDPVENVALKASVDQNQNKSVLLNEEDCVVCKKLDQKSNSTINDNSQNQNSKYEAEGFKTKVGIDASNETPKDDHSNKALVKFMPLMPEEKQNVNNDPKTKESENTDKIPSTSIDDPLSFANANQLTFNKGNSNAFCRLCNSRLPSSLRSMKEHVAGASHKNKAAKVAKIKANFPKKPMKLFIKNIITIQNIISNDIIINDKYFMSRLSYLMISKHGNRFRCQACEENLTEDDIGDHEHTSRHILAMNETHVVWNLPSEFIREVRPGLFHCAFCNLIVGCWDDVDKHLKCEEHRERRSSASSDLRDNMPAVLEHRERRESAFLMLMLGHLW